MDVISCIEARHCKRGFLDKPVPKEAIETVLSAASHAASSKNTQPWEVAVVSGSTLNTLSAALCQAFDSGKAPQLDYAYFPDPIPDALMARARACGHAIFNLKGIARDDYEARRAHARENFLFFGAPLMMILYSKHPIEKGGFLDIGMYLQTLMLGLVSQGFGSCPQASVAGYPDEIRKVLSLGDCTIICGLAVGVEDPSNPVNQFIPERRYPKDYTQWYD